MSMSGRTSAGLAAMAALALILTGTSRAPVSAAGNGSTVTVKLSDGPNNLIPRLADSLGYLKEEGIELKDVKVEDFAKEDYLQAEVMHQGHIDATVHWFHHVLFGAGNNAPVQAVMLIQDTPGMTIMVANRVKDQIKSAADFKGRKVAEGAAFSTKSYLTHYMTVKAGLPPHSYTPVAVASEGRKEAVLKGLNEGAVDVMAFMEPMTSSILATKMATPLYDLTTAEGTRKALGDVWPAQCLFLTPDYIKAHPDTTQHLVNAFVKTMRFVNTHTAEQIADKLPASYFAGKNREAEVERLRKLMPTFAKGDYSLPPTAVKLVADAVFSSTFDNSDEGKYRAHARDAKVSLDHFYDNRFVEKAMKEIK